MDHNSATRSAERIGMRMRNVHSVGQQKKKKGRAEQSRVDIQNYYSNNNHIIINECNPRNINNDWLKRNTRTERSSVAGRSNTINTLPHDHSL